jgi:hypothetical protein
MANLTWDGAIWQIEFYLQCSVFEPGLNPPINFLFKMRKHISRVSRKEKSGLLWLLVWIPKGIRNQPTKFVDLAKLMPDWLLSEDDARSLEQYVVYYYYGNVTYLRPFNFFSPVFEFLLLKCFL